MQSIFQTDQASLPVVCVDVCRCVDVCWCDDDDDVDDALFMSELLIYLIQVG